MPNCILLKNSYITIQPFMVTTLNLSGNSLIIYAAIYGITVNKGSFHGSVKYLAAWCNSTEKSVIECLKKLTETGLIKKTKTPRGNIYVADTEKIYTDVDENSSQEKKLYEKSSNDSEESSVEWVNKSVLMGNKSSHNILDDILVNNLGTYSSACACEPASESKELWGIGAKQKEFYTILEEYNKSAPQNKKIAISKGLITFVQRELRELFGTFTTATYDEAITAIKNYLKVASSESWKTSFSWRNFVKEYLDYTPEYFDESKYAVRKPLKKNEPKTVSEEFKRKLEEDAHKASEKERVSKLREDFNSLTPPKRRAAEKIFEAYQQSSDVYSDYDFFAFSLEFAEVADKLKSIPSNVLLERFSKYFEQCIALATEPDDFKTIVNNGLIIADNPEE